MLTCFCGKMGAGKTTRSRIEAAEKNAVLLSEDAWLAAHYPDQIHTFDDYLKYARQIRGFVRQHVQAILGTGTNVVMDFPANTRRQRQWFVQLCEGIACELELVFLDTDDDTCLARLATRRLEQPERAEFDTEAVFRAVTQFFEAPNSDEQLNIRRMAQT